MTDPRWVVLDTNVFGWVGSRIDTSLTLIELIVDTLGDHGVAAHRQLKDMHGFERIKGNLADLPVSDEQTAAFLLSYRGAVDLQKVHGDDPNDVAFLVFALGHPGATLVTNERALLQIASEIGVARACLKAAVHQIEQQMGGVFSEASFKTDAMFDPAGKETFFHYHAAKRCGQCDPKKTCQTQRTPPRRAVEVK